MSAAAKHVKSSSLVERIADAVLYEGYILYPYRPSAVKNQQRWNFGVLCPESFATAQRGTESSTMRTECLVESNSSTTLAVKVRFLHLMQRELAQLFNDCSAPGCEHLVDQSGRHFRLQPSLEVNGEVLQAWQEAIAREVVVPQIRISQLESPLCRKFVFPASRMTEALTDNASGAMTGMLVRTQRDVVCEVEISAQQVEQSLKLSIVIRNLSAFADARDRSRDDALMHSTVSTHTILELEEGSFISLLDPPASQKAAASACINTGTYPVLVGDEGNRNCMLSSPIILYDYPQIAPESAGNLFDGTEIDEILTLRIMSLTDDEKREMRSADELARQLLERTESMSAEQLLNLHGVMKKVES